MAKRWVGYEQLLIAERALSEAICALDSAMRQPETKISRETNKEEVQSLSEINNTIITARSMLNDLLTKHE